MQLFSRFGILGIRFLIMVWGESVSVRTGLLAILIVGPAYGFQLHGELASRTAGRRRVNAGQIYGTLDRLLTQGAIESAGITEDGLPLYRLTPVGRTEALGWIVGTDSAVGDEWDDLVDRVLLATSLPRTGRSDDIDALSIIASNRSRWIRSHNDARLGTVVTAQDRLAAAAASALADAALLWLDEAERRLLAEKPGAFGRGFSEERPRRGRRPASTVGS